ncbi:MAG TPA: nitroreductase family protein [Jatrophihabitans sp.]|nr:nitroreductase family protein [Jatrophihabitans sp.]
MSAPSRVDLREALIRAAEAARLAPSIHNTQPWSFHLSDLGIEIRPDWSRQLKVADPAGRELLVSCGCALMNAQVALAAAGFRSRVEVFPGWTVRISIERPDRVPELAELASVLDRRRANRREHFHDTVDSAVRAELAQAAQSEGASLLTLANHRHRVSALHLATTADSRQRVDPAYLAELATWTHRPDAAADGLRRIPLDTYGPDAEVSGFDTRRPGWHRLPGHAAATSSLFVLSTAADSPRGWLHAGAALERVWLVATRHGYAVSVFSQLTEVADLRRRLCRQLALPGYPQVLLRVGHAPATPATPRRPFSALVTQDWRGAGQPS